MTRALAILTFTAAIAFVLSPFASSGFNGFTADQFPVPQVDAPVQPAGYAFSIWGVIYLWLVAAAGFGLLARADSPGWAAARPGLFASLAMGAFWIPLAQVSVPWATLLIWAMLLTALHALLRAGREDRLTLREPIGLYAGWLTAASSVSVGLMLAGYGVTGPTAAALIALTLALAITLTVQALRPDTLAYPLAAAWALAGVAVSNLAPMNPAVLGLALAGIGAIAIQALRQAARA